MVLQHLQQWEITNFSVLTILCLGFDAESLYDAFDTQLEALEKMGYSINRADGALYYSATLCGRRFIFMSVPDVDADGVPSFTVTQNQLDFIDEELYKGEKSNETAFLVSHVGLSGCIPDSDSAIINSSDITKILAKPRERLCLRHTVIPT